MVLPGAIRSPALLDHDVGDSLSRQWVRQQPNARRGRNGDALTVSPDIGMDWEGRLAPGASGVRLLVLTLLCWGAVVDEEAQSERALWNRLAEDFTDVFNVLAAQAGPYEAPAVEVEGAAGESGKRIK